MTIFKSRQVNLDPKPYELLGVRYESENGVNAHAASQPRRFDPRPEFEPTRDPEPWIEAIPLMYGGHDLTRYPRRGDSRYEWRWAPRREQFDTPVNPILAEFRAGWPEDRLDDDDTLGDYAWRWFDSISQPEARDYYTPEQIEHARKVLTRLAALT